MSLESILQDLRALQRGMEVTRREFSAETDNTVLQTFLSSNAELLHALTADGKTAQVASNNLQTVTRGCFLGVGHVSHEL